MKAKIVLLTGAGMSAESGIATFRDSDGLWENYPVQQVASIDGFNQNPQLVLDFYNARRKEFFECAPNEGHLCLASWEDLYDVTIITQNIDNLHEQAGSQKVIHLHGEILKNRSVRDPFTTYDIDPNNYELHLGDLAPDGQQLRPFIVWFGEDVPQMIPAIEEVEKADAFVVIGTSLNVYPAASLLHYVSLSTPVFVVDPKPISISSGHKVSFVQELASQGVRMVEESLAQLFLKQ